jgi:hypothetical protein
LVGRVERGAFGEDVGEQVLGCFDGRLALGEPLLARGGVQGQNVICFKQVFFDGVAVYIDLAAVWTLYRGAVAVL